MAGLKEMRAEIIGKVLNAELFALSSLNGYLITPLLTFTFQFLCCCYSHRRTWPKAGDLWAGVCFAVSHRGAASWQPAPSTHACGAGMCHWLLAQ